MNTSILTLNKPMPRTTSLETSTTYSVSFETAKKLTAAGWKKSHLHYCDKHNLTPKCGGWCPHYTKSYCAPMTDDLLERLPSDTMLLKSDKGYYAVFFGFSSEEEPKDDEWLATPAEALAHLALDLADKGLMRFTE